MKGKTVSESDREYAANLASADMGVRMRQRDSNARCYARAMLDGDTATAARMLEWFAIADAAVNNP
jgi:hypothetical protein